MMSFRGQASRAKKMSSGGKLTVLACHPTKKVNKAEELSYLSTDIGVMFKKGALGKPFPINRMLWSLLQIMWAPTPEPCPSWEVGCNLLFKPNFDTSGQVTTTTSTSTSGRISRSGHRRRKRTKTKSECRTGFETSQNFFSVVAATRAEVRPRFKAHLHVRFQIPISH